MAMAIANPALAREKPNFLIVVADDLGWSDPGFLGSKIRTPNIDGLYKRGTFLSHFYVAPTCSPTRSMLMTGVSNHAAGVGSMHRLQAPNQIGLLQYGAQLHDGVVTVAEMLKASGYATMMSGKWHLAIDKDQYPSERGFENSFGLIEGGASHFADQRKLNVLENVTYHENGAPVKIPDNFYSTIGYTDKIIQYIDGAGDRPFFAYLAYTAPHDPLQVPNEWLDRYRGAFDSGPDDAKEARRQNLVKMGLLNDNAKLDAALNFPGWLPSHKVPWEKRDSSERKSDIRRMEIYAAMVELLDEQMGRVIDHLEREGKLDNTYVIFMSDNGASVTTPLAYRGNTREWLHSEYDLSAATMGKEGSFTTMGREWANVSNTPFDRFKATIGEGGVRSPMIIAGPDVGEAVIQEMPRHVMDLTPTIFDLAGINTEGHQLYKDKLRPQGVSMKPMLANEKTDENRILVTELFGNRMARKGRFKAMLLNPPFGSGKWELFDIVADPSAKNNIADRHPALIGEMRKAYEEFAEKNKVVAPNRLLNIRLGSFYEGKCAWSCEAKFWVAGNMPNSIALKSILIFITLIIVLLGGYFYVRKRNKGLSVT